MLLSSAHDLARGHFIVNGIVDQLSLATSFSSLPMQNRGEIERSRAVGLKIR
jgi:hypothetical protein